MHKDDNLIFSVDQALVATADSTNIVDMGSEPRGTSNPLFLIVKVTEDFAAATSYSVDLHSATAVGGSYATTGVLTPLVVIATLVDGYFWLIAQVPPTASRFLKLVFTENGITATAGKVDAYLVTGLDKAIAN